MIPKSVIDLVIDHANSRIGELVGDYVQLKKHGSNMMGCCPFHNEKTPSFSVSPKGFYKCFGCGKGGNSVNFVMELEKLTFPDAIRFLGKRFGIDVPEQQATPEQDKKQRERDSLFTAAEYAARQFESNLRETDEGQALGLTYFRDRGFRDDTMATFRLGYAMQKRDNLLLRARADGYRDETLLAAGLISQAENGAKSDRFHGRVIFPIQNSAGKVIGFGGRVLDSRTKGVQFKYLNSPETELYIKSDIVYGIYQARTEMSKLDKCYLVEGYTDVISMHQSGIANVVASSGTALTTNQIRLIKRFTKNITILYDGDGAGIRAAMKGIDLVLREEMNVRVLLLPDGDDPDSFSRKHTAEEFQAYVQENETDFISFMAKNLMEEVGNDPIRNSQAMHTMVNTIAEVQDQILRELYVRQCAKIMNVTEETLFNTLSRTLSTNAQKLRDREIAERRIQELREKQQAQQANPTQPGAPADLPPDLPPDLSPSELAALGYAPQGTASVQTPTPQVALPRDVEFREVMRLFVTYAQKPLGDTTVAERILQDIDADNIRSQEEVINNILSEYRNATDRSVIDDKYYLKLPDPDICQFVADAVGGRQELSRIHSKYATVEKEEAMLDYLVPRALDELRWKHLMHMIAETTELMNTMVKEGAADEEVDGVLKRLIILNGVKKKMAMKMGERVITPKIG